MKNVGDHAWVKEFVGAVVVCDTKGVILEMNDQAIKANEDEGGAKLIGTNLLDCHPEPSRSKVVELLASRQANVYTVRKKGKKKLIHQTAWFRNGKYSGLVEVSFEIPDTMPHFDRD